MKYIIAIVLVLFSTSAIASPFAIFDAADPNVPFRVLNFFGSADDPDYIGRTDAMICIGNCLVGAKALRASGVPTRHWKVDDFNKIVVGMTQAEKDLIDADSVAAAEKLARLRAKILQIRNNQNVDFSSLTPAQKNNLFRLMLQYIVLDSEVGGV